MKSKRETKWEVGDDIPAPGCYDAYVPSITDGADKKNENKPIVSKLPRYHEIVTMVETKKAVPGPGHYEIRSQFEKSRDPATANPGGANPDIRPSFGSQAKRFSESADVTPAPTSYDDPRHALEICNKISGLKRSPFGMTATRFTKEHHVRRTPGPGTYNYTGLATEVRKNAAISRTRKGVFGTTAVRELPLRKKNEEFLPGPAQYVMKSNRVKEPKVKQAVFKSTTTRLHSENPGGNPGTGGTGGTGGNVYAPPPGSYEVATSFDQTQGNSRFEIFLAVYLIGQIFGGQKCRNFDLVPKILSAEKFIPPKILFDEVFVFKDLVSSINHKMLA